MELESITLKLNEFELKTLRDYLRMGIKHQVEQIFDQENKEDFENWLNDKNDELEFMSTICKYYNDSNLVEYAKRMYQNLTD